MREGGRREDGVGRDDEIVGRPISPMRCNPPPVSGRIKPSAIRSMSAVGNGRIAWRVGRSAGFQGPEATVVEGSGPTKTSEVPLSRAPPEPKAVQVTRLEEDSKAVNTAGFPRQSQLELISHHARRFKPGGGGQGAPSLAVLRAEPPQQPDAKNHESTSLRMFR